MARDEFYSQVETVISACLMAACICCTIVGNTLVIMSVFTYKPLRCVSNYFIISLAVADLMVAVLVMPFHVVHYVSGHWVFGEVFCNMWLTFDILACTASILNLCAIATDRYYAIHDAINYAQKRTSKRVLVTISAVWFVSVVISAPPLLGWNNSGGRNLYDIGSRSCELTNNRGFVIYSALGSFYIPLLIMAFIYANIFLATRKRLRARSQHPTYVGHMTSLNSDGAKNGGCLTHLVSSCAKGERSSETSAQSDQGNDLTDSDKALDSGESAPEQPNMHMLRLLEQKHHISLSKERRAARTMAIIIGVFVLCWLPFFLIYVIFPFCPSCAANAGGRLVTFIVWLGYVNSSLNPIIYTIFNIDFRKSFKQLLQCKCKR